jgi:hypothetical protein
MRYTYRQTVERRIEANDAARERARVREESKHKPVCSCPRTMRIDGIDYECVSPMGAGCQIHGEERESKHVSVVIGARRVAGRVSGNHRSSEQ